MRKFWIHITLLNILLLVAIGAVAPSTYEPLAVTRVDNLEVAGSLEVAGVTDATQQVTARNGLRLTHPSTGPIFVSGTGSPDGSLTATIGSVYLRTDTAQVYQNADGATAWTQVGGSSGAGFQGAWSAGTYSAGAIVTRGPWMWGTTTSTTQDPAEKQGNMGLNTDWKLNGNGLQDSATGVLTTSNSLTAQNSSAFSLNYTYSGFNNRRLVIDAQVGPSGGADYFNFGIYDSSLATTIAPGSPGGLCGTAGAYGINIDFGSNQVGVVNNGTCGSYVAYAASAIGAGNDILENSVYYRFYMDITSAGGNTTFTLWRDNFILSAANNYRPGYVAAFTVVSPSFTDWRFGLGSTSGGVAGLIRAKNAWVQYKPGTGAWTMMSELPHTPRIDESAFQ